MVDTNGNRNKYSTEQVSNLQLHLNCVFNCGNVICTSGRHLPAASVHSIKLVGLNFHKKSSSVYLFIFVKVFLDEVLGKSFRFPQVLIKILSSELNIIFHFIALLLLHTNTK